VVATWFHGPAPDRVRRAAALVAATAATIAAVALVVPVGPFVHWTFSGNGGLLFGFNQAQSPIGRGLQAVELFVIGHLALCFLVLRRGWHREDLDLWLWLVTGVAAFAAGFRYFGHYWLQVLPPLCMLAAPAIDSCRAWLRAALVVLVLAPTAVYWGQAWTPIHGPSNIDQRAFPLVAAVRHHTTPHDLVTVWGSFPEVYWLSGRAPGGALVLSDFIVGRTAGRPDGPQRLHDATPGALHDFLASLRAHPPRLFLDTATGHVRKYGHYPLSLVPPVERFVVRHYRPIAVVRGVTIYELVPAHARGPATTPPAGRSGAAVRPGAGLNAPTTAGS